MLRHVATASMATTPAPTTQTESPLLATAADTDELLAPYNLHCYHLAIGGHSPFFPQVPAIALLRSAHTPDQPSLARHALRSTTT